MISLGPRQKWQGKGRSPLRFPFRSPPSPFHGRVEQVGSPIWFQSNLGRVQSIQKQSAGVGDLLRARVCRGSCCSLCSASISMPRMPRFRLPYSRRSPDLRCSIYICISRALFLGVLNSNQIGLEPHIGLPTCSTLPGTGREELEEEIGEDSFLYLAIFVRPQRNRFFTESLLPLPVHRINAVLII